MTAAKEAKKIDMDFLEREASYTKDRLTLKEDVENV